MNATAQRVSSCPNKNQRLEGRGEGGERLGRGVRPGREIFGVSLLSLVFFLAREKGREKRKTLESNRAPRHRVRGPFGLFNRTSSQLRSNPSQRTREKGPRASDRARMRGPKNTRKRNEGKRGGGERRLSCLVHGFFCGASFRFCIPLLKKKAGYLRPWR